MGFEFTLIGDAPAVTRPRGIRVVADHPDRENGGDLTMAAEAITLATAEHGGASPRGLRTAR